MSLQRHSKELTQYTCDKIECFYPISNSNEFVPIKCLSVYDGDTIKTAFHLYNIENNAIVIFPCRLFGIDTPEIKSKSSVEKIKAIKARDFLRELLLNKCVWAKFHTDEKEKYGRLMVDIYLNLQDTVSVNQMMINEGLAYAYFGGKKE